jgi:hypothetical protein
MLFKAYGLTSAFLRKDPKPSKTFSVVACFLIASSSMILISYRVFKNSPWNRRIGKLDQSWIHRPDEFRRRYTRSHPAAATRNASFTCQIRVVYDRQPL